MNLIKSAHLPIALAIAMLALALPAEATVTLSWSAGASCGNAPVVGFSPGGATFQASLCASTTAATERGCGFSVVLLAANAAESGIFSVTARTLGANYPDITAAPPLPFQITNPAAAPPNDFGGTIVTTGISIAPAANQLLATFTFQALAAATNSAYVIRLASPASEFSVDAVSALCASSASSNAAVPSLALNQSNSPIITSAATTTFTVGTFSAFSVTATGAPPLTFTTVGALPAGVSLTAGGVLAGTPQTNTAGTYPLTVTASNGNLPHGTQNFSLIVTKRTQTISFGAIAGQFLSASPIAITNASSSSLLPLTFTTTTTAICTVSGASIILVMAGTCTITASQGGNADIIAATSVSQTFAVSAGVLGAPVIGPVTGGNQIAIIAFSAPASNGGSVILDYSATCSSSGAAVSATGTASPLIVTGLANGTIYTCSVRARNAFNAGPASATATVTPMTSAITLSSNTGVAAYGAPLALIATVSGSGQTGTVAFVVSVGSASVALPGCSVVPLVNGSASCTAPGSYQNQGSRTFAAHYSGDANNLGASASLVQVVATNSAVLTITATPLPPIVGGRTATLTALIKMASPAGTLTFTDNGVPITGCIQTPLVLLPDVTDSAVVNCLVTVPAGGNGIKQYVATYFYPAGHISGKSIEQSIIDVRVVAQGPLDYTDMWWAGASENGWGISVTQHGPIQFNVIFAYDELGKSLWYVMPGGSFNAAGNVFTGSLYLPISSPFSAYDKTKFVIGAPVGIATISYTSPSTATLAYTINGISATKSIQRQVFSAETTGPNLRINDLWWATFAEDGWGMNIAQQGRVLFPVWYTYDAAGKATFFTVQAGSWRGTVWSGTVYAHASSAWLGVPYNPAPFTATIVGNMTLDFSDASNATMTYTVNGITQVKTIQRQPY